MLKGLPMYRILATLFFSAVLLGCESSDDDPNTYSIGGTITGLSGDITLSVNGTAETFTNNGEFTFKTRVANGDSFSVMQQSNTDGLNCDISNNTGSSSANVTDVEIQCDATEFSAYDLNGLAFNVEQPSVITFAFHLIDRYTDLAIDNITNENINQYVNILEDGTPVSASESFLEVEQVKNFNAEYTTVFAIDISSSLTKDKLQQIITTIKSTIVDPVTGKSKLNANQYVSLITFDSAISTLINASQDADKLAAALDNIELGANSTNLNGAIKAGSELWENEISLERISYGSLIVFTDGNDTSKIVSDSDVVKAVQGKDIYFIAIGNETDTNKLTAFTSELNIFSEFDFAQLSDVLDSTFTRVKTYEDGLYILSYATPIRAGKHTLTIEAIDDYTCASPINQKEQLLIDSSGNLTDCADEQSYEFNAEGFSDVVSSISIVGTALTFLDSTEFYAKTRWSKQQPQYSWDVKQCVGSFDYDIALDDASVSFTRTSSSLAVALVTLTESESQLTTQSYAVMVTSQSDIHTFNQIKNQVNCR